MNLPSLYAKGRSFFPCPFLSCQVPLCRCHTLPSLQKPNTQEGRANRRSVGRPYHPQAITSPNHCFVAMASCFSPATAEVKPALPTNET